MSEAAAHCPDESGRLVSKTALALGLLFIGESAAMRRKAVSYLLAGVVALFPACGAAPAASPAGYAEAARAFSTLPIEQRVREQLMLASTGYWLAVPTGAFGEHMFDAVKRFQSDNNFTPTGILTAIQADQLTSLSDANFRAWGFRKIRHPFRNVSLWIPYGLDLTEEHTRLGLVFKDPHQRIEIDFVTLPDVFIADNFVTMQTLFARDASTINYKVFKDGWYVISASDPDGVDKYLRYHQEGDNVTGFTVSWKNANGDVHGERIATLMSASLWADTIGPWSIDPPVIPPAPPNDKGAAIALPPVAAPSAVPPPSGAAPTEGKTEAKAVFQSGTGFFVANDGVLLTNAHVVHDCSDIHVKTSDGMVTTASVRGVDVANDLALLQVAVKPGRIVSFRTGVRLGEGVEAFGFPHTDMLSTSGNFTLGNITALSGLGDDSRYFQISVPVQAGNSGGPLLDQSGNVVGIVTAKLNALKVALENGDLPQNVNFALKGSLITAFLDSNQVTPQMGVPASKPMDPPDLADEARAVSGFVICRSST